MNTVTPSLPDGNPVHQDFDSELLRCPDSDEAVLSTRHPFVAYKETNRTSGAWRLRINSRHATTAILYPNAIRLQARAVSAEGKSSFTWSNTATARSGSPEKLQFRVLVNDGEPAAIEVLPRTTKSGSPLGQPPVRFCWPAA